jgi:hypothetical protein
MPAAPSDPTVTTATPAGPAKPARKEKRGGAGDLILEALFDGLFATELGLLIFGGMALAIGLPLLVVFGGAALAAHIRRKREPGAKSIGLGALLTPAVLVLVFLVLILFGALSFTAFETGHAVVMVCSYVAALATLAFLGFMVAQRRAERLG